MLVGTPNFRDLGGHAAGAHRQVRRRIVYRSSQLSHLTDADVATVQALGIAATIDFRSDRERMAQPTPAFLRRPGDYLSPKPDTDFVFDGIFAAADGTEGAWARAFGAFYTLILDVYAPEFDGMFRALLRGDVPLLIHCSAGKDRTGAASALLLDLLGVDREVIIRDYLRSSELLAGDMHFRNMLSDAKLDLYSELPLACRQVMLGTDRVYLEGLFETIDERFGSVERYLVSHGFSVSDVRRIVDELTEHVPGAPTG